MSGSKKVMGVGHHDDTDVEHLSMIISLYDIGFTNISDAESKTQQCS